MANEKDVPIKEAKKVFEEMQGFDEDYFFCLEETDLCYRLNQAGSPVYFLPQVTITHFQGSSATKDFFFRKREFIKGLYLFFNT